MAYEPPKVGDEFRGSTARHPNDYPTHMAEAAQNGGPNAMKKIDYDKGWRDAQADKGKQLAAVGVFSAIATVAIGKGAEFLWVTQRPKAQAWWKERKAKRADKDAPRELDASPTAIEPPVHAQECVAEAGERSEHQS